MNGDREGWQSWEDARTASTSVIPHSIVLRRRLIDRVGVRVGSGDGLTLVSQRFSGSAIVARCSLNREANSGGEGLKDGDGDCVTMAHSLHFTERTPD